MINNTYSMPITVPIKSNNLVWIGFVVVVLHIVLALLLLNHDALKLIKPVDKPPLIQAELWQSLSEIESVPQSIVMPKIVKMQSIPSENLIVLNKTRSIDDHQKKISIKQVRDKSPVIHTPQTKSVNPLLEKPISKSIIKALNKTNQTSNVLLKEDTSHPSKLVEQSHSNILKRIKNTEKLSNNNVLDQYKEQKDRQDHLKTKPNSNPTMDTIEKTLINKSHKNDIETLSNLNNTNHIDKIKKIEYIHKIMNNDAIHAKRVEQMKDLAALNTASNAGLTGINNNRLQLSNPKDLGAGWSQQLKQCVQPNLRYNNAGDDNPRVEFMVKLSTTGSPIRINLTHSSGNTAYDSAVERALHRCDPFPKPASGGYPINIRIGYRLND